MIISKLALYIIHGCFKIILSKTLHGVRCGILSKQKNRKREIPGRYLRMATAHIPLPEKLDSKKPEDRKRWIERFQCYRIAAGPFDQDDKVQINTLV